MKKHNPLARYEKEFRNMGNLFKNKRINKLDDLEQIKNKNKLIKLFKELKESHKKKQ